MKETHRRNLRGPRRGRVLEDVGVAGGRESRMRRRLTVACLSALLLAAAIAGARALSSPGPPRVDAAAAADPDGQVPPDYLLQRALGGAATVSRTELHRAAAQALAIGSAGGSWEYTGANNIGGRVTDVVVDS